MTLRMVSREHARIDAPPHKVEGRQMLHAYAGELVSPNHPLINQTLYYSTSGQACVRNKVVYNTGDVYIMHTA